MLDERHLIGGVVDDEVTRQPDLRRLAPEESRTEGVKGREPHPPGVFADQRLDPLAHLPCRLVGEGHRKDVVRLGVPVANEIGDPIGDDARLAGAGAGEDQEWSITMEHRFALFGI